VAEAPAEAGEAGVELRPVLRRAAVDHGEAPAVLDEVPVHELRAEPPDAARDLGRVGGPHGHGRIVAETSGARRGRRAGSASPLLLVVLGRLLRRRRERDHLLAVDEDIVLGRVLVGHVVAGAAVDAVDLIVGCERVHDVVAVAAVLDVRAGADPDPVVPVAAVHDVVAVAAAEHVVAALAVDRVAAGAAADEVVARAAEQTVVAAAAVDPVVPGLAVDGVVAGPRRDEVGAGGAD